MEIKKQEIDEFIIPVEEKGDLAHAIRCTEQAGKRANSPWLKEACAFRLKMLKLQQAKQKQMQI